MPRSMRASRLETRTARLKLPVSGKPDWVKIGHGVSLGYRRNQGPGTWVLRVANGTGGHWTKALALADDFDAADGGRVLDFWQAQDRARDLGLPARHGDAGEGRLLTVADAVDAYERDLPSRGGDIGNAARIRVHLPPGLAAKTVATLSARDFKPWRAALIKAKLTPASINRSNGVLRACLNFAADQDERIVSARAWEKGLSAIPDATVARNTILPEPAVRAIVAAAYTVSAEFGLLVEVAAVTGARVSQLARLEVRDLQAERADPRLMMPTSRKGRGRKKIDRRPVPIPAGLATQLAATAKGRPDEAALLIKANGVPWGKSNHTLRFANAVRQAGVDAGVTMYALRHSSIVRALLAGVPIRVVAVNHDTSVGMLEKTYSRDIGDHADVLSRRALLDLSEPPDANVIALRS